MATKKTNKAGNKMLAYIFYSYTKQKNTREFFSKELKQPSHEECPVFLQLDSAMQHARFMSNKHIILQAYVDEEAIEGRSQELFIKTDLLKAEHVRGYYPHGSRGDVFYPNPHFVALKSVVLV